MEEITILDLGLSIEDELLNEFIKGSETNNVVIVNVEIKGCSSNSGKNCGCGSGTASNNCNC